MYKIGRCRIEVIKHQKANVKGQVMRKPRIAAACIAIFVALGALMLMIAGCSASVSNPGSSSGRVGVSPSANASSSHPSLSSSTSSSSSSAAKETAAKVPEGSTFSARFLDVGQGDAAIIECDGHYMIVDGGPPDASRLMYSYCRDHGINQVDYLVATHPDTDHTGGISGALQIVSVGRAFCSTTQAEQRAFQSMEKYLGKQGVSIEVPRVGETFSLGGATVQVVGPVYRTDDDISNDDSIVLMITYGETSFLLTGDATEEEEHAILSAGYDIDCDLLKVSHHGSAHSSSSSFLRAASPSSAVISVAKDNGYGHPSEEALTRLDNCGATVYRTDLQGDITATSDGTTVNVSAEKGAGSDTTISASEAQAQQLAGISYIGNLRSHKFHLPTCKNLPKESNRIFFDSRQEAVDAGYTPCGNCKP